MGPICLAAVMVCHNLPVQIGGAARDEFGESRLGDGAARAAVVGVVTQLVGHGPGVCRDGNRADRGARIPRDHELGAVLQMDENSVAGSNAPAEESGPDRGGVAGQLSVGPCPWGPAVPIPYEGGPITAPTGPSQHPHPDLSAAEVWCLGSSPCIV